MKIILPALSLFCLHLCSGCAYFKPARKITVPSAQTSERSPKTQAIVDAPASSSLKETPTSEDPSLLRASGQSNGLLLFGIVPVWKASPEKARASLFTAIGKDVSDSTITLQKQSISSTESHYLLFSIPRISFSAEIVRSVPYQLPSGDPMDIPGATLRKGIPVFSNP